MTLANWAFGAIALSVCTLTLAAESTPDMDALSFALGKVEVSGVDELNGNAPVSSQGSGFFIRKSGYFVTAYHLLGDLGEGLHDENTTYRVVPRKYPDAHLVASMIEKNVQYDFLVLFVDVSSHTDIDVLHPARREDEKLKVKDPLYTEGYEFIKNPGGPVQEVFVQHDGKLASIAAQTNPPVDRWQVDIQFEAGMSGAPFLASDGRVVGIGLSSNGGSAMVTPIDCVNDKYFGGSSQFNIQNISQLENASVVSAIGVETPNPVVRTHSVELHNAECSGPTVQTMTFHATDGWTIDKASVKLTPTFTRGSFTPSSSTNGEFTAVSADGSRLDVEGVLSNAGDRCHPSPLGHGLGNTHDVPAVFAGNVVYKEVPSADVKTPTTLTSVKVPNGSKEIHVQVGPFGFGGSSTSETQTTWEVTRPDGSKTELPKSAVTPTNTKKTAVLPKEYAIKVPGFVG